MVSQLSRADLLECLAGYGPEDWENLADVLGYTKQAEIVLKLDDIFQAQTLDFIGEVATPPVSAIPTPQTRFLRPLSRRRLNQDGSGEPPWFQQAEAFTDEDDPAIAAPPDAQAPEKPPLMPWPRLWPFLKSALGAMRETHRPDLSKTIDRLARGAWLRRLPRARRPGWAADCLLLIDFAEPLLPFWGDFHELKQRLPPLRGQSGFAVLAFPEGDPLGRVWREEGDDWQTLARFPLPKQGTPVLVLSDLGCHDVEPQRRQRWLRFGEKLKRAGCRPVALMPCPPRRWDGGLARLFDLACWDRAARLPKCRQTLTPTGFAPLASLSPRGEGLEAAGHAERLLALLSPAIRVEPGLLRTARLLLPAGQADVGTEADVWNHAAVRQTLTAFYYEPAAQTGYRQRFPSGFDETLKRAVARLLAEHHAALSPFILHEEALVLRDLLGEAALAQAWADGPARWLDDAEALQRRLAKTCADASPLAAAAKAWVGRLSQRSQPAKLWQANAALEAAWAFAHREALAQGRIGKLPPGLSLSRVAWVLAGQREGGTWTLRQTGGMLHAEPAFLEGGKATLSGSLSLRERAGERGITVLGLASTAPYATLASIAESDAAGLSGFFHPQPQPAATPSGLLSLIHPLAFSNAPPPPAAPFPLQQPIPLPETALFRLATDREDWLFDQIAKPDWADAIGRDRQGLYVEVQAGPERLRLYWQPGEAKEDAGLRVPGTWGGFDTLGRDGFGLWAEVALYAWKRATVSDPVNTPSSYFKRVAQRFRRILPGTFLMGSPATEPERESFGHDETQHKVTLTRGFWLADSACTQAFWQAVMGSNPSQFKDDPDNPVETVSWNDAQAFIARLNEQVPGLQARLPSEAEWEYACRAGTTTPFSFGANITTKQVNYNGDYPYAGGKKGEYRGKTVAVKKSLPPNEWGLYEMHGNVWEWCQDWLADYAIGPQQDPTGPLEGVGRVLRGGSWIGLGGSARSACRGGDVPDDRHGSAGFRLSLGPTGQQAEAPGLAAARERGGLAGGGPDGRNPSGFGGQPELKPLKTAQRKKRRKK